MNTFPMIDFCGHPVSRPVCGGNPLSGISHVSADMDRDMTAAFYMCCFYNLARGYKSAPATDRNACANDRFPPEDPARMTAVMRQVAKPCLGFKFLAATRNCATPEDLRAAFDFALANIKPTDALVAGMFPKYVDQVAENAALVREFSGA